MKTTEERIKALEAELQQLKQDIKPEFKTGWYKVNRYNDWLNYYDFENKIRYGFDQYGNWMNPHSFDYYMHLINKDIDGGISATESEVFEALKKEAIKRGFKEGCVANNSKVHGCIYENNKLDSGYSFHFIDGGLYYGNLEFNDSQWCIFKNGKWAEIIKDEPIKIGSYKVEKIEHGGLQIGCKKMNIEQILNIKKFMDKYKFTKVAFDGIETDLETINKILNL